MGVALARGNEVSQVLVKVLNLSVRPIADVRHNYGEVCHRIGHYMGIEVMSMGI